MDETPPSEAPISVLAEDVGVGMTPDNTRILLILPCSIGGRPYQVGGPLTKAQAIELADNLRQMAAELAPAAPPGAAH